MRREISSSIHRTTQSTPSTNVPNLHQSHHPILFEPKAPFFLYIETTKQFSPWAELFRFVLHNAPNQNIAFKSNLFFHKQLRYGISAKDFINPTPNNGTL